MLQPKKPVKKYVPTAKEKKNLKDAKEQKNMRPPFTSEERKKMPRVGSTGSAKNGKNIKKAKTGTSTKKASFGDTLKKAVNIGLKVKGAADSMRGAIGSAALGMPGFTPIVKNGKSVKKCKYGCK
jgi:hypothetical protein